MADVVDEAPKAILYCWPGSFLSMVPRLVILEKGFNENEYTVQLVDASLGETFSPSYLSFVHVGDAPGAGAAHNRGGYGTEAEKCGTDPYTLWRNAFLDQARTPYNIPPEGRIPPMLSPVTDAERELTESLICLVCSPQIDPNFLELSARNQAELQRKRYGPQGSMLSSRQMAIDRYLAEARSEARAASRSDTASHSSNSKSQLINNKRPASPPKNDDLVEFLQEKAAVNEVLLGVYNGEAGPDRQNDFFESSNASWSIHLPSALGKLERLMIGPFALGDDLKLADCYIIVWLARIVAICGGEPTPVGLNVLEHHLTGYRIGSKLHYFWGHWIQRSSFRRMQVTSNLFPTSATQANAPSWGSPPSTNKPVALSWG